MLNFNSILVGTMQTAVMAEFYGKVFGKQPDMAEEDGYGWQVGSAFFTLLTHSEMGGKAKDPARLMFNLETAEVNEEFARISAIAGASVVKEPYDVGGGMRVATLADPDGNYFQLMSPWSPE
jgi:predicted enzyme related to lactoylglutathione lyase